MKAWIATTATVLLTAAATACGVEEASGPTPELLSKWATWS